MAGAGTRAAGRTPAPERRRPAAGGVPRHRAHAAATVAAWPAGRLRQPTGGAAGTRTTGHAGRAGPVARLADAAGVVRRGRGRDVRAGVAACDRRRAAGLVAERDALAAGGGRVRGHVVG